jgi:23S rRNA pseudouridine2457 synthase
MAYRTIALHKPWGMLSQFTSEAGHPGLSSCAKAFPRDVYPVGRLDRDSEGLLLLTNDSAYKHRLLDPVNGHLRMYWAQVEGAPDDAALLQAGGATPLSGGFTAAPAEAHVLLPQPEVTERTPPIRQRAHIPTTWIEVVVREGKNRQVRRMTAAWGFPTLRLIRVGLGTLRLADLGLQPGEWRELTPAEIQATLEESVRPGVMR